MKFTQANEERYEQTREGEKVKDKKEKKSSKGIYILTNRTNATKELFVGRRYFRFMPFENKDCCEDGKEIGMDVISHADFKQQSKYFTYKEK